MLQTSWCCNVAQSTDSVHTREHSRVTETTMSEKAVMEERTQEKHDRALSALGQLGGGLSASCGRDTRSDSSRQGLQELVARHRERGLPCELTYSSEGDYEYATLTYGRRSGEPTTVRYGWRAGEEDNASIVHTWLWLGLKQAEHE